MKDKTNRKFWDKVSLFYNRTKDGTEQYEQIYTQLKNRLSPKMDVLELATGTGMIARNIASSVRSIQATDFSPKMIAEAQKIGAKNNVNFSVQDACQLPYASETFDTVIISNALHIMPTPELALKNIHRVLKTDGVLIAPTFVHDGMGFSEKTIVILMQLGGFKTYHK